MEKLDFIDSKFRFALFAAKRAKQLVNGSKKRIDMHAENPLTVALEEIYQEKVNFKILDEEELLAREEAAKLQAETETQEEEGAAELLLEKSEGVPLDDAS